MINIEKLLKEEVIKAIYEFITLTHQEKENESKYIENINFEIPKNLEQGNLCTSIACQIPSRLPRLKLSPKELASKIVENLKKNSKEILDKYIKQIKDEDNGFINFVYSDEVYNEYYRELLKKGVNIGSQENNNLWKYLEIVSANPTGYLHIGHTRNGIFSDTLANIFEYVGYSVKREYLVNDSGNQIFELLKSFWVKWTKRQLVQTTGYIKEEEVSYNGIDIDECLDYLWDRNSCKWFVEEDSVHKSEMYPEIKEAVINYFLDEIKRLLNKYKIKVDYWQHEKDLATKKNIDKIFREIQEYTTFKEKATWLTVDGKSEVLVKANGDHTYFLQDIIYHRKKLNFLSKNDEIVNVLGSDHYGHIDKLNSFFKAIGEHKRKIAFVCMQLVQLIEDEKVVKMSKRDSTAIMMRDLEKYMSYEEVRWFFVSQPANSPLEIDIKKLQKKDYNNPVFYVMYAYSRICQIIYKYHSVTSKEEREYLKEVNFVVDSMTTKEKEILNMVISYDKIVLSAANTYSPHKITQYLYKLAQLFHSYYEETNIIGGNAAENKSNETPSQQWINQRLALIKSIKDTIFSGLSLLRIEAKDEI